MQFFRKNRIGFLKSDRALWRKDTTTSDSPDLKKSTKISSGCFGKKKMCFEWLPEINHPLKYNIQCGPTEVYNLLQGLTWHRLQVKKMYSHSKFGVEEPYDQGK